MTRVLVIGLSGQVGAALEPMLLARGYRVLALSRDQRQSPAVEWLRGSIETMPPLPGDIAAVISLGPLDAFANWYASAGEKPSRVIALGSTGREDKSQSADPHERELAGRLRRAEDQLFEAGRARASAVTLLRPTLLYGSGSGRDRTLSRLVQLGQRWPLLPLPATATGLRQPVHVQDVADAVLRCVEQPSTAGKAFDLPGAEALGFIDMVRRTLARRAPHCRVVVLPAPVFHLVLACARRLGIATIGAGVVSRLGQDQSANATPAQAAFGYAPRAFEP